MSQAARATGKIPEELRSIYAPIREELDQVEEILGKELSSEHPFVDRLVQHGFRLGGKRLRPALVLLSAKACGPVCEEHLLLAAVVEMIHMATLIHDDVLDEALLRRHLDTVNARWDNEASILLGDYLFTHAIHRASSLESSFACRTICDAVNVMCEGELRQVDGRGDFKIGEEAYLEIITGKTAALCVCCAQLGAHYAGANETLTQALAQFGRWLGVAFQITDDLLDLIGDEEVVGKSLGTDLVKQKATLPLIRLLDQAKQEQRTSILEVLSSSDDHYREKLRPWFEKSDAIDYAQRKASYYVAQAQKELDIIPPSTARDMLGRLAKFTVCRQL